EPEGCNCDNKTEYDRAAINAACTQALSLASQGQTLGRDKYPHVYSDYEKFSFQYAKKPYLEFPILEFGVYNDNESPGADRVVIDSISTDYSSAVFCAVITHDGSTKNGFAECKDDTVNTSGKGTWDTEKTKGRGREPGPGRQLLDRIDLQGRPYVSLQPNSSDQYQS
ncbi:Ribonuclease/ribotoxin, partial [Hyaloscypha bicolor E]